MRVKLTPSQDEDVAKCYKQGKTAQQIADDLGIYKQVVLNSLKRSKVERRKDWERAKRSKNGHWKSGVRVIKNYIHILIPEHPLARKDGYVPLHRLLASYKIGRQLLVKEVVNHKDLDTFNNSFDNFEVFANNGEHIKKHVEEDFMRNTLGQFSKRKRA